MVIKIQLKFLKKSNNIINKEQYQIKVIKSLTEKKFNHTQYSHTPKKQKKAKLFYYFLSNKKPVTTNTCMGSHITYLKSHVLHSTYLLLLFLFL